VNQDKYHGQGGSYVVNDKGERELVERTTETAEGRPKPEEVPPVADGPKPARSTSRKPA
jgi:hypothetical protein